MSTTTFGPVDFVVLGSAEQSMPATVDAAILALAATDAVSVIDLVHLEKSPGGELLVTEMEELPPGDLRSSLTLAASGLATDEDLAAVGDGLEPGTSALVLVVEHTWARNLVEAVRDSSAYLVTSERVPAVLVNEVVRAAQTAR